ncbi:protein DETOXIFICATION 53 [Prosopis cineraria]|uniref:protein DETOXIFICATION 53 n=1 Tax=Prosopis cineraria TaxID=364024 RepID=UPI00240F0FDC|nr:protein DETOXIFICATION 53 [Prosopis cineraria]XP_054782554.1 protein DETOXIFICATION 53 [Prosopis cineraria]
MCTGNDESRGILNGGEAVTSKVQRMRDRDDDDDDNDNNNHNSDEGTSYAFSSKSCRFVHGLLHHLTAQLPSLSLSEVREESQSLAKVALPIIATSTLMYSRSVISMLFLGRQGKAELAGGSLAIGFANITGISVLKGLTMGMDPICCQAYGAKRWSVLSQTFHKMLCLLLLISLPIILLWINMTTILQWLGQDLEVTKVAQVYLLFSIPELLAQAHLFPLRAFLRTQGLTTPLTVAASCAAVLHAPVNYFLAMYLKLGVKGVALATGLNSINMNLGLVIYLVVSKKPLKPWQGHGGGGDQKKFFIAAFQGWGPLLSLALPSCLSVCLEWWWYEIMLFLCGLLGNPQTTVATMGILIQTTGLLYIFPFSLSSALTTRVGHSLGAGQPSRAQCTAILGLSLAFIFGVLAFFFTVSVRKVWARMFTNEIQIIDMVTSVLPIVGLCEIGNWPQTASWGILSGTARPNVGARINLCAFYGIGLPVAIVATFVYKFDMLGLWSGMLAAQISCFAMMLYTLCRTDWGQQSKRAEALAMKTIDREVEDKEEEKEEGQDQDQIDEETGLLNSDL